MSALLDQVEAERTSQMILEAAGVTPDVLALHLAMADGKRLRTLKALEIFERAQFKQELN